MQGGTQQHNKTLDPVVVAYVKAQADVNGCRVAMNVYAAFFGCWRGCTH